MYSEKVRGEKEWMANHRNLMIDCPNQPGKLLISKNVCRKRYQASLTPDQRVYAEDFFRFAFLQGLSVCRDCPIGRQAGGK